MPKIEQLPSGSFRARVYAGTDPDGKKRYKSITGNSKKDVKLRVAEFETAREESRIGSDMTVRNAIRHYIAVKSNVLSPATVKGYDVILRNRVASIMDISISRLTLSNIQSAINDEAARLSPKTVRNTNALVKASIELVAPSFKYSVTLPQKEKTDIEIPTEEEVAKLFQTAVGRRIETPLYLGAMCGMRRSEIFALRWENVNLKTGTIDIIAAEVIDINNKLVRKAPKKTESHRRIKAPRPVIEHLKSLERTSDKVTRYINVNDITEDFSKLEVRAEIPHYRFHDLRHYTASVMLMLNVPKKYVSDFLGHSSERMVETVYGHIMRDKKQDMLSVVDKYFTNFSKNMT